MFTWENTSWSCPACQAQITLDDLRERQGYYCPGCGVQLRMVLKGHWAYVSATIVIAFLIVYLQESDPIVAVFRFFIYAGVITLAILYLSWPLMLPKKFIVDEPHVTTINLKPPKPD